MFQIVTYPLTNLEIRARTEGRTLCGICVPWDEPYDTGRFTELFRAGAFAKTIQERQERIPLFARHDESSLPLGRSQVLKEESTGLYGEFRIARTQAGDEAIELIREGVLHSLSVGFIPIRDRKQNGVIERIEAKLDHVGLVPNPAYDGAKVLALRQEFDPDNDKIAPRLAIARKRLQVWA